MDGVPSRSGGAVSCPWRRASPSPLKPIFVVISSLPSKENGTDRHGTSAAVASRTLDLEALDAAAASRPPLPEQALQRRTEACFALQLIRRRSVLAMSSIA